MNNCTYIVCFIKQDQNDKNNWDEMRMYGDIQKPYKILIDKTKEKEKSGRHGVQTEGKY